VHARSLVVSLAALLVVATPPAGASNSQQLPLRVQTASLTQHGQQLSWSVELIRPFSPTALKRDRRSLCLLIERARKSATVTGQLCVVPPLRGRRQPRLVYMRVTGAGPGPEHVVPATVTRTSTSTLTATFLPASVGLRYRTLRWQVLSTLRPPACVPALPDRIGCFTLFPATARLARLHTPELVGCVPSGAPFVTGGPTNRHVVALTFDDGPWYDTPQFLDVLEREHVEATFFEIGEQISTYGEGGRVQRRMLADGDMIGDHTWSHPDVSAGGSFAVSQIQRTAGAIRQVTGGFTPCLFRAPGGAVSHALVTLARGLGFTTIQWNVDPRDWARPGADAIYQRVVGAVTNGSIVIQHDGGGDRSGTLAALPREIETLKRRGYRFVTVTELLGDQVLYR
jgi:peptidoglycan-N-acetylglucosamine deacetylase